MGLRDELTNKLNVAFFLGATALGRTCVTGVVVYLLFRCVCLSTYPNWVQPGLNSNLRGEIHAEINRAPHRGTRS